MWLFSEILEDVPFDILMENLSDTIDFFNTIYR